MVAGSAIVVMGVSGCGKTTVGRRLAQALGWRFVEGDALHPAANIEKMSSGTPLDDADRLPWLEAIASQVAISRDAGLRVVISCSALKRGYRDRLRDRIGAGLRFVYLHGTASQLQERLGARGGHFMPRSLLQSQLNTLELPVNEFDVLTVAIDQQPDDIVREVLQA